MATVSRRERDRERGSLQNKTGMESDDMKYTGFKISLCCKNTDTDLHLFCQTDRAGDCEKTHKEQSN